MEKPLSEMHAGTRHAISAQEKSIVGGTQEKTWGKCKTRPPSPPPQTPVSEAGRLWASVGRDVESVQF